MSTDTEAPSYKKNALEFKSTSFSVPVLGVYSIDLKQIDELLDEKIAQAPDFFKHSPLLIDLHEINAQHQAIDLSALIKLLHAKNLIPIAISGGNEDQNNLAIKLNIPAHILRGANSANNTPKADTILQQAPTTKNVPTIENKLISQPIRSGQRVYAKGDLTILSHVSAGAEIMAEGNIHVYGALRGRALAGVQGNTESRIFCSLLQAELISIAGHYKTSEELDKCEHTAPVHIFLKDQALIVNTL